jgi:hypothetical protein
MKPDRKKSILFITDKITGKYLYIVRILSERTEYGQNGKLSPYKITWKNWTGGN